MHDDRDSRTSHIERVSATASGFTLDFHSKGAALRS